MSAASSTGVNFSVGHWRVYPRLCRVEIEGRSVHLTPRAMEVLVYLAARGGEVVSRGELLDAIWPRMEVSQDALTQCVVELRKAFNDSARQSAIIETIPKVGIRLVPRIVPESEFTAAEATAAPVPVTAPTGVAPLRFGRKSFGTALGAVALATLAVTWLGGRPDEPGGGESDPPGSPRSVARAHYESGNRYFNRNNDRGRMVTMATNQYELATAADPTFAAGWAQLGMAHTSQYFLGIDRTQDRLAAAGAAIEKALQLDPDLPEGHLAKANYLHRCIGDVDAAIREFAEAERLQPSSPTLYVNRSSLWRRTGDWEHAKQDLERAMSLDPANVIYIRQQFINYMFTRDYDQAAIYLDKVASLASDDASVLTDRLILALVAGRETKAARLLAEARSDAGPGDARAFAYTRWLAAVFDRDYDRAERVLMQHAQDQLVDFDLGHVAVPSVLYLGRTRMLLGRTDEAMREFDTAFRLASERLTNLAQPDARTEAFVRLALAESAAGLGDFDTALREMRKAREILPRSVNQMDFSALQISSAIRVLLPAGDRSRALAEFDDYLSAPGIWSAEAIARDPRIDPIARDPAFLALLEKHRGHRH